MPFLHRDRVALHFERIDGNRRPIVFIHGWCCDRTFFAPQAEYFSALGHQILLPDLRGHGLSDKPEQPYPIEVFSDDLAWMCGALKIERPVFVGHSMGGIIAFDIAARYPDLPSAIALLDAAVVLPEAARAIIPDFVKRLRSPGFATAMRDLVGSVFFIPSDDPERKARILDFMAQTPQHVMADAYGRLAEYAADKTPNRVTVPSLYIAADEPSARTDMARLDVLIPHLNVGRTVCSGHFCQLEVPDQINAMLARFIATTLD
jgi:pimeloyl-ACP methyl ester carboxylesterase